MSEQVKNNIVITPFLYNSSSLEELLTNYSKALRASNDLKNLLHANKLNEIKNILLDNTFLSKIKKHYESLYSFTKRRYPDLKFYLAGRRKDIIGSEKKINLYLLQDRSMNDFKDIFAFRFILFNNSIESCYDLMQTVIDFNIEKGFIPCNANSVFQTEGFDNKDFPNIIIPKNSSLPSEYKVLVKDYILNPKSSGYQSLHVVFEDPSSGRFFEIQIRTFSMHINAESHSTAGHNAYKKQRYSDIDNIDFDRSKIKMDGYAFVENQVFDFIGLEKPYQIIQKGRPF